MTLLTPVWDDLRFPAQAINPAGAAVPPTVSNTTGMLEFAGGSTDNTIAGQAQMPHNWKYGTSIDPHIHTLFTTAAANVSAEWRLEYNVFPLGSASTTAYGSYTTLPLLVVKNPNDNKVVVYSEFNQIPMVGCIGSTTILWRLTRVASDTVNDTDSNAVALTEIDFHYQIDKLGSPVELPSA